MRSSLRFIGFTAAAPADRFLVSTFARYLRRPSETFSHFGFNCPLSHSPSEFLRLPCLAHRPRRHAGPYLPRFRALFAASRACVHFSARLPTPRIRSVRRFSQPLDVFLARTLAGLFHPATTSRALLFRVFSSHAATPPHRKEPAPMPLFPPRSPPKQCPRAVPSAPRLRST